MTNSRYIFDKHGIFIFFKNREYSENERQDASTSDMLHPVKIHLSLAKEEYRKHKDALITIILPYVEKGTVSLFKDLNYDEANQASVSLGKKLSLLRLHEDTKQKLAMRKQKFDRFLNGDQFTIYFPKNLSLTEIQDLCHKLVDYLKNNNVRSGGISEFAMPITDHLNLRKAYLDDASDKRVDGSMGINEEEKAEVIRKSYEEISKDQLYIYLKDKFPVIVSFKPD
jgi:hypothetical protein